MPLQLEPWVAPVLELAGILGTSLGVWKAATGKAAVQNVAIISTVKKVRVHGRRIRRLEDGQRDLNAKATSTNRTVISTEADVKTILGTLNRMKGENDYARDHPR